LLELLFIFRLILEETLMKFIEHLLLCKYLMSSKLLI